MIGTDKLIIMSCKQDFAIILMFFIYRGINGSYKLTDTKIDVALEYINNNYDKNINIKEEDHE